MTTFAEFLDRFQDSMASAVVENYPPQYTPADRERYDLSPLRRRPMGAQSDAIRATAKSLKTRVGTNVVGEMGTGKAQPLDSRILTPVGWRRMGDLKAGDEVVGRDGLPHAVVGVFPQGEQDVFRVTFSDGASVECTDDHLWTVNTPNRRWHGRPDKVLPLREIRQRLVDVNGNHLHFVPLVAPVEGYREFRRPLDAYMLGVLIGDGCMSNSTQIKLSSADAEIVNEVAAMLPDGMDVTKVGDGYDWNLSTPREAGRRSPANPVVGALRELGLMGCKSEHKFIPRAYLQASLGDRIALLQGLMDTDGYIEPKRGVNLEFVTVSSQLAADFRELVESLGGVCPVKTKKTSYVHNGERREGQLAYRLTPRLPNEIAPFRLSRKAGLWRYRRKYQPVRAIAKVELVGRKPCQCIAVDAPDQLYVTEHHVVTHNTYVSLSAAYLAGMKRVVVVCPPHLVHKWKREVEITLPNVHAVIAASLSDLQAVQRRPDDGKMVFVIISRERSKLSYQWEPATVTLPWSRWETQSTGYRQVKKVKKGVHVQITKRNERGYIERSDGPVIKVLCCPHCHSPILDKHGAPIEEDALRKKRMRCDHSVRNPDGSFTPCNGALWTASRTGPRRYPLADWIGKKMRGWFDLAILDECFPGDTPVATPTGPVRIEDVRPGDEVLSWKDGEIVVRRVVRTIRKQRNAELVTVQYDSGTLTCTPNHRIKTAEGYKPALSLSAQDTIYRLEKDNASRDLYVSDLRAELHGLPPTESSTENVWQQGVCGRSPASGVLEAARAEGASSGLSVRALRHDIPVLEADAAVLLQGLQVAGSVGQAGGSRPPEAVDEEQVGDAATCVVGTHEAVEPGPGRPREGGGIEAGADVLWTARGQRPAYARTEAVGRRAWLAYGVLGPNGQPEVEIRDGRPGVADVEDRGRVRWSVSSYSQAEEQGPAQDGHAGVDGLDGVEVLERGDHERSAASGGDCPGYRSVQVIGVESSERRDEYVYDLEVEDTHCYFAGDVLVSNCHEAKAKGSAQGIAYATIASSAKRILTLTGTVFGGYSSTLFYLLYRFSPEFREEFGYGDEQRWIDLFGIRETVTKRSKDDDDGDARYYGRSSKRKEYESTRERPGLSPAALFHLIGQTVFVSLPDVASNLPPYTETVKMISMQSDQAAAYESFQQDLHDALTEALVAGSKRLLGAYLQALLGYPERCYEPMEIYDPSDGELVASVPGLGYKETYPKEQALIDLVKDERKQGRRVWVYITHTHKGETALGKRLKEKLAQVGIRAAVLDSASVPPDKREAWIQKQVDDGADVVISHPKSVATGLDLIAFPTMVYYQTEYSVYTMRQSSRRSWRIGQEHEVKIVFFVYEGTLQSEALSLVAAKMKASLLVEGNLADEGLAALNDDSGDVFVQLAKRLDSRNKSDVGTLERLFADTKQAERASMDFLADGWTPETTEPVDRTQVVELDLVTEPAPPAVVKQVSFEDFVRLHPATVVVPKRKAAKEPPPGQMGFAF